MQIEKANAVREIQFAYEELVETAIKLESEGLRLSKEIANASSSVSGKEEIINNIKLVGSPTGVDSLLRLDIARKCTLKSLARTLKDIYIKYGEHCIKTTINLLPFSSRLTVLEGIATEELREMSLVSKKLLDEAKDELTWGEGGIPTKCPPVIAKDKMEEIINKHLKQTFRTIYLVYAEQCVMKSFKFYMQIKQFDGCNDEERSELNIKASELIEKMSDELEIFFENIQIKNLGRSLGINIENIISEYIIKVHELDKKKPISNE